jgi:hypothetical protein
MEICDSDRYAPLETALNGVGFKVEEVEKQGKKTVITVVRCGKIVENPGFSALNAAPTVSSEE